MRWCGPSALASRRRRTNHPGCRPRAVSRAGQVRNRSGSLSSALGWAAAVTATEAAFRYRTGSRSRAWLLAYSSVGAAAAVAVLARGKGSLPKAPGPGRSRTALGAGLALAGVGYPLGRLLLGDRPKTPPPESIWLETAALAGIVAPAEELVWGAVIEPSAGIVATSVLFAAKHVAVDHRWRRSLGLALFGVGLGLLRLPSRKLAVAVHVACNAGGVALGHLTGRDQF